MSNTSFLMQYVMCRDVRTLCLPFIGDLSSIELPYLSTERWCLGDLLCYQVAPNANSDKTCNDLRQYLQFRLFTIPVLHI